MVPPGRRESGNRPNGSLSVGVLVDSGALPAWQASLAERLGAADFVEVVLFETGRPASSSRSALLRLYDRLDHRHYRLPNDAFAKAEIAEAFPRKPTRELPGAELDVLVRLSRVSVDSNATFGDWSVREDDAPFLAVHEGRPVAETVIEVAHPRLGPRVIYRSASRTEPLSPYRNRNLMYWKAAEAIVRRLETLHRLGFDALPTLPADPPEWVDPTLPLLARQAGRVVARELSMRRRERRMQERWFVAYRRVGDASLTELAPPNGHFFADPFLIARPDGHHLFFEDYGEAGGKGVISHVQIDGAGRASEPQVALDCPYHLSYPFVFEADGETWMVPETAANRTIELHRATRFPLEWQLERVLVDDVHALDSTLVEHDGWWWLFTLVNPYGLRANSELHLYSSPSLDGEWTPHPLNPVVTDVRCARPAGRVQRRHGELVRLGQDSGERYGHAIAFNKIELLTETDYREAPLDRMTADVVPGSLATHTYDTDGTYEVVDALRATTK